MKLITEYNDESNLSCITEEVNGEKKVYLEGIFMQADKPNRNKRYYSKEVLYSAVDRYINEYVNTGRAMGELNHPDSPQVNPERASHRITELRWDGSNVVGKALVLNTPMGNIVKGLLEGGVKLGVSSRGLGTVRRQQNEGISHVNKDFILTTVDVVSDPSAPDAYVNGIMEGVEYDLNGNGQIIEKYKYFPVEVQAEAFSNLLNRIKI